MHRKEERGRRQTNAGDKENIVFTVYINKLNG